MTVYVDDMKAPFGRMIMCHMMADTLDELHAMADRIGMRRAWFQDKPSGAHYDLSLRVRARAVKAGAVEITYREMGAYAWHRRTFGCNCAPALALEKLQSGVRPAGEAAA